MYYFVKFVIFYSSAFASRSIALSSLMNFSLTLVTAFVYMGSSTETVAFQVYEILKINYEFLQFFWLGSKV